jgi:hypothetical protein
MSDEAANQEPEDRPTDAFESGAEEISVPLNEIGSIESADKVREDEVETMIDVHAPHHPVTTWKDFLLHIAVVTIGLLLAIGLEQTVEFFHHRHQVAETRKALAVERKLNVIRFQMQTEEFHRFIPKLQTNLAILVYLRQHPGAPASQWPGKFQWYSNGVRYIEPEWKTAHESNVLQYMSQSEVREYSQHYDFLDDFNDLNVKMEQTKREAYEFYILDADPSRMTPQQLDHEIEIVMKTIYYYAMIASLQHNFSIAYPDFTPAPTLEERNRIFHDIFKNEDTAEIYKEAMEAQSKEEAVTAAAHEEGVESSK